MSHTQTMYLEDETEEILQDLLGNKDKCRRFTWNYQIYASNGEIKAEKRIAIWVRHDDGDAPFWKRHCLVKIQLDPKAYYLDENGDCIELEIGAEGQDKLKVVNDTIEFNGGFLRIADPGIKKPLHLFGKFIDSIVSSSIETRCEPYMVDNFGIKDIVGMLAAAGILDESVLDAVKDYPNLPQTTHVAPFGRNIHIEVEFEDKSLQKKQPLFFFPQNDSGQDRLENGVVDANDLGVVFLAVGDTTTEADSRGLYWGISKLGIESDPFEFGLADDKHMIMVSQDTDRYPLIIEQIAAASQAKAEGQDDITKHRPYFEIMIDSIGIGAKPEPKLATGAPETRVRRIPDANAYLTEDTIEEHRFGSDERVFYVGYAPEDPPQLPGWAGQVFHGKIHRIFFDPNASCGSC